MINSPKIICKALWVCTFGGGGRRSGPQIINTLLIDKSNDCFLLFILFMSSLFSTLDNWLPLPHSPPLLNLWASLGLSNPGLQPSFPFYLSPKRRERKWQVVVMSVCLYACPPTPTNRHNLHSHHLLLRESGRGEWEGVTILGHGK